MEEALQELDVELIPGTEILSRNRENGLVLGEKGGYDGMILVPQPSLDLHDPLVRSSERNLQLRRS